jgi:4-amino-4-deoxy-L-arabinose transferase-like glycosyltransferase
VRPLLEARELAALGGVLTVGIGIRLVQISQPFVDRWSSRQADVAMIARNFHRHGFNLLYPQIDWAGSWPGYVGTEFPLVPFLASLVYLIWGEAEWIGRSISVVFFAASVPFLYLLVRKVWNPRSAFFAVIAYTLAPLGIFASRSFMPDMASLALSIAALYLFAEWLDREAHAGLFAASCAALSLAILVKLPTVIIGVPLAYLAVRARGAGFWRTPALWVWAAVALGFPLAWYLHAHAVSVAHAPHHMFGEGGLKIVDPGSYAGIAVSSIIPGLTPLVTLGMLIGLLLPGRSRFAGVFGWWCVAIAAFTILAGRGASWHAWYQLPLVPVAAALAGRVGDVAWGRLAGAGRQRLGLVLGGVSLATVAALATFYVAPLYKPWANPLRDAGRELDRIAPAKALAVFTEWDPTTVYYSDRKGWRLERSEFSWQGPHDTAEAIGALEALRLRGAQYLLFTRHGRWWFDRYPGFRQYLESRYPRVPTNADCTLFELSRPDRHAGSVAIARTVATRIEPGR